MRTYTLRSLMCRTAHRAGVTYATTSLTRFDISTGPSSMIAGLSVTFRTGSAHALASNAIVKHITALHVVIGRPAPFSGQADATSVSTQVAVLRKLLLNGEDASSETGYWFRKAARVRTLTCPFYRVGY